MATVVINRTNEYVNRFRDYGIYIDGKKAGYIANGETKEFTVSSGHHSLIAKIDWCTSRALTFDIDGNEVKDFKVGGFKYANWIMQIGMLFFFLNYIVNKKYSSEYLFYLIIPGFLLLVYHLSFGRKRYLTLRETKPGRKEKVVLQG